MLMYSVLQQVSSVCSSVWYRKHDLLGARVRTVLRGGARHQMSQRAAGADAGHPDGLHLHTDVLHLPEQRGENEQVLTKFGVDSSY